MGIFPPLPSLFSFLLQQSSGVFTVATTEILTPAMFFFSSRMNYCTDSARRLEGKWDKEVTTLPSLGDGLS